MFRRHPILTVVTVGYLCIVGVVTLAPVPQSGRDSLIFRLADFFDRFAATRWLDYFVIEFLANVAMFLPLGLFLLLLLGRARWWLGIILAIGLTFAIEFAQQFLPSRVSDPRDIVANSIGAGLGVLLGLVITAGKARALRSQGRATRASYSSS